MGMVAFQWLDKQLTVHMNRDNWISRDINKAAWDHDEGILEGRCDETGGTWFGVTETGRVAFLVEPSLLMISPDLSARRPNIIPIEFLKGNLSPETFAAQLAEEEDIFHSKLNEVKVVVDNDTDSSDDDDEDEFGRTYNLVVADINSGSMVYICKSMATSPFVRRQRVAFGTHTLSLQGLDYNSPKDQSFRITFNELMCQNQERPGHWRELAQKLIYDPTEDVQLLHPSSLIGDDRYRTTNITTFIVDHTKQAEFTELYLKNDEWVPEVFTFNIV